MRRQDHLDVVLVSRRTRPMLVLRQIHQGQDGKFKSRFRVGTRRSDKLQLRVVESLQGGRGTALEWLHGCIIIGGCG